MPKPSAVERQSYAEAVPCEQEGNGQRDDAPDHGRGNELHERRPMDNQHKNDGGFKSLADEKREGLEVLTNTNVEGHRDRETGVDDEKDGRDRTGDLDFGTASEGEQDQ